MPTMIKKFDYATHALALLSMLLVLKAGLLLALFSGLLVYSIIRSVSPYIARYIHKKNARLISVGVLSSLIVLALIVVGWGLIAFFRSDAGNVHSLLQKLADIIDASSSQLPAWLLAQLPRDVEALQALLSQTLREHAGMAKEILPQAGHVVVHLLLGMIIACMIALNAESDKSELGPLAQCCIKRIVNLSEMFHRVVFAQIKISAINTSLTAIYLIVILPLAGIHLPLTKSMIAITFVAGMIPVLGNIVSNTVIVIVALSHSFSLAVASLVFMIVIHKAEYFLNARIIGGQVNAKAWELLCAMLLGETLFGIPGVIAAPVFYAWIKFELKALKWV